MFDSYDYALSFARYFRHSARTEQHPTARKVKRQAALDWMRTAGNIRVGMKVSAEQAISWTKDHMDTVAFVRGQQGGC